LALLPLTLGCFLLGVPALASPARAEKPAPAEASKLAGAMAGQPYTLTVAKVSAKKGQEAAAQIVITPAAGYHLNVDFPTALKLTPPAGVTAAKVDYKKADAKLTEKEGSFAIRLTASAAGKQTVPGELRFAVCTDTTCDPQRTKVAIELDVK
jgi:hypothetical protein